MYKWQHVSFSYEQPIEMYSSRAQLVLFLDSRPSIRLILYNANMSTDNENQSLMKIYFNNCSESKMAARMADKIRGFIWKPINGKGIRKFS